MTGMEWNHLEVNNLSQLVATCDHLYWLISVTIGARGGGGGNVSLCVCDCHESSFSHTHSVHLWSRLTVACVCSYLGYMIRWHEIYKDL